MESITIKDIAKICGVGVSTVSRAMNNHPDINDATKQKVIAAMKEYNYVPNNSARNLKRVDTKTIAVLIKGITNPFFTPMIKILEQEINKKKYSMVLQHVDEGEDEVEVALQLEKEKRLKGIIFLGGLNVHTKEKLEQIHIPFVKSTGAPEEFQSSYVSVNIDNKKESQKAVEYLINNGHTRIALLAGRKEDQSISQMRLAGYRKALEIHAIPFDEELVSYAKRGLTTYSMKMGYEMTKDLLESGKAFSAVYALSDLMAIGACKAIFDAGKSVPQDYSVMGFDGVELADYYQPSITTLKQPVEEMAYATFDVLFSLIKKKEVHSGQRFSGELKVGQSVKKLSVS